jgi:hypothetical protein
MLLRRRHSLGRGINAQHVAAQPRQRLGRDPGAAADIQQPPCFAMRGPNPLVDPADPKRVHRMQRPHRAGRIPPPVRQAAESLDLVGPHRGGMLLHACHVA